MAEYILLIQFCSLIANDCTDVEEHSLQFADYYSCMLTAYADGMQTYEKIEPAGVNEFEITIRHQCIKIETYE